MRPVIVAHRGHAREFPENTWPAFESALALGAAFIELDVQFSRDGVPVCVHDADLGRVSGEPLPVLGTDWPQLAQRSVGEPARFGRRFEAVRPMRLDALPALLAAHPAARAFVELKGESIAACGLEACVAGVGEALRAVAGRCWLIGYDPAVAAAAADAGFAGGGWVLPAWDDAHRERAQALAPDFLFVNHRRLPPAPEPLWPGRWQWVSYEIDTLPLARALMARGVCHLETMAVRRIMEGLADASC